MALLVPLRRHLAVAVMASRTGLGLPMIRALTTILQDEAMEVRPLHAVEGTLRACHPLQAFPGAL